MRRPSELRMVRRIDRLEGVPSMEKPARTLRTSAILARWRLARSGSAMSSKKKFRKSSRDSVKTKSSSPSPLSLAREPVPPPPCCWRSKESPLTNFLLPG
ncbi:hypothetical protein D3C72_2103660 [compost metagenome]